MPLIAEAREAAAARRRAASNGTAFWFTSYLGPNRYNRAAAPAGEGALTPVGFLVEQDPETTVAAHFHQADQFQVMVAGGGTLGRHPVVPGTVHFTGAFSAYGPIRAGAAGLAYFTLRNGWDPGARYMPGARTDLPRGRRHREAAGAEIAPEPDGLVAARLALAPGAPMAGPDPAEGAGMFWVVLDGALELTGARLGPRSCAFVAPGEAVPQARAAAAGATVLALRFPRAG